VGAPAEVVMEKISKRLLSWASVLEDNTREQAERTASMPFIFPHLALMPDAHLGLGSTVGSVIPTLGAIIPAAVGVDIGCGMIAVRTQFTRTSTSSCETLLTWSRSATPCARSSTSRATNGGSAVAGPISSPADMTE
jgi:tRNA-splicing ligase RtcB